MVNLAVASIVLSAWTGIANASTIALIVIDVQNCFTLGGTLEVAGGSDVVPVINQIRHDYGVHFDVVVLSQDWHCSDHVSFASQHAGYGLYDTIQLDYTQDGE